MISVGCNLLLALRIKREAETPDAALLGSSVLSIAQIGTMIAVGLVLVSPSVVALLGRWFWWPRGVARAVTRG